MPAGQRAAGAIARDRNAARIEIALLAACSTDPVQRIPRIVQRGRILVLRRQTVIDRKNGGLGMMRQARAGRSWLSSPPNIQEPPWQ